MLDRLPPELILMIFGACGDRHTQVQLSSCLRTLRHALIPRIYLRNVQSEGCSAALWAVLRCHRHDAVQRIVEASVRAGMDVWALQFSVTVKDIFPRRYISRIPRQLHLSAARLSLFAIAVLRRKDRLVMSLLDAQGPVELHRKRLLAPEITTYLDRLTRDRSRSGSHPTALHVASATGLDEVVKRILKETPAEVASVDAHGRTPLCYAIRCPLTADSTIKLLLNSSADANVKITSNGSTVSLLTYCCREGLFAFASSLLGCGVRGDLQQLLRLTLLASSTSLQGRTRSQKKVLIENLVECGANPNGMVRALDAETGERPLLLDVALTSASATKHLLAVADVDVNIQDSSGWTTLSRLLLQNHRDHKTAALLLERGAKLQLRSFDWIIHNTTFWSLQGLMTMLSRHENTFNLFRVLYHHCISHTEMNGVMMSFLASVAPQSAVLARMSEEDIRDIRRGNTETLLSHFEIGLLPLGHVT